MSRGDSVMGLLTCMCRLTKPKSSWSDMADMKECVDSECDKVSEPENERERIQTQQTSVLFLIKNQLFRRA